MAEVLVVYSSRMGSTAEIAEAIGNEITTAGLTAEVHDAGSAPAPEAFDAVVVGSAVYTGRWLKGARRYLRHHRRALADRPVWLFQSGPAGTQQGRRERPSARIVRLARKIGAKPPTVFGGNLDPARATGRLSTWVARSDLAGDYRDFDQIRAWARQIAASLFPQSAG